MKLFGLRRKYLSGETSPYLLQHKDNPVRWRPWGDAAFDEARKTNRPVFLSIGYAACHWCHVMAHESFENPRIAEIIDRHFIPVKVDREERPDIDAIYQAALAALGSHGGWPLTMFLTARREPFWGGTYFPDEDRHGLPSFRRVLEEVARWWQDKPKDIQDQCLRLRRALDGLAGPSRRGSTPAADSWEELEIRVARRILEAVDSTNGGLRGAPKFPQAPLFALLYRHYRQTGEKAFLDAFGRTVERMSRGGIYDHLGGGYCRYSVDARWLVPHFEKMLYDNAQILEWLAVAWRETGKPLLRRRIEETIAWVEGEMRVKEGLWASSLDADSPTGSNSRSAEGAYYVWTIGEIRKILGSSADPFIKSYGVRVRGNWAEEGPMSKGEGRNILHQLDAGTTPLTDAGDRALSPLREQLRRHRAKRPAPARDDKVLCDSNAMMIAAWIRAGQILGRPAWITRAGKAFDALWKTMMRRRRLHHSAMGGKPRHIATLDDIAHLCRAALYRYEASGDATMIEKARTLFELAEDYHRDSKTGGYFLSASDTKDVIVRVKSAQDQALPSGQAVLCEALTRLWLLTGKTDCRKRAEEIVALFAPMMIEQLPSYAALANAAALLRRPRILHLHGSPRKPEFKALAATAAAHAGSHFVISREEFSPAERPALKRQPAAVLCRAEACSAPIHTAAALKKALAAPW